MITAKIVTRQGRYEAVDVETLTPIPGTRSKSAAEAKKLAEDAGYWVSQRM